MLKDCSCWYLWCNNYYWFHLTRFSKSVLYLLLSSKQRLKVRYLLLAAIHRPECPHRNPPQNGYFIIGADQTTWYEGDSARIKCNAGYNLVGNNHVTCQGNSHWSSALPKCLRKCLQNFVINISVNDLYGKLLWSLWVIAPFLLMRIKLFCTHLV